jgi:hypothetical protein
METPPILLDDRELADDEPLLDGLGRRLAWTASGAGVVLLMGSVARPWLGLAVLGLWFLPLLCHAGFRLLAAMGTVALVGLAGFGALSWRVVGFVAVTLLEEVVLVLTVALLVDWLL